jgi:heat shock protein HslJ
MRSRFAGRQGILVLIVALTAAACGGGRSVNGTGPSGNEYVELEPESGDSGTMLHISGTVRHIELEGGLFVIEDADGTRYNPTNLPETFRVDGKVVEADARRRDDMVSIGQVGPIVELVRIRERAAEGDADASGGDGPGTAGLEGSRWRLEDLAGAGVLDNVQATLEFGADGRVTGNGSCNGFGGTATVTGAAIQVGPLVATRKACVEAVMNQETNYMRALEAAERFELKEPFLYIYAAGHAQPLRFIRS